MAGVLETGLPLFTRRVAEAMNKHFPEELADKSWDNVGLLVGNTDKPADGINDRILLTNDLTLSVAEEAIENKASVIISYHPFIFSGLKSISPYDPQQASLLHLIQHNIAVYCPHTAVDAAPGGVNDWLADIAVGAVQAGARREGYLHDRSVVKPVAHHTVQNAGYGRLCILREQLQIGSILASIVRGVNSPSSSFESIGDPGAIAVAWPSGIEDLTRKVQSIAVCAGSGYDVLKDTDADVIVTGEMSHHHALRMTQMGKVVVTLFHSNSERGFLRDVLSPLLEEELRHNYPEVWVRASSNDRDPFRMLMTRDVRNY